MSAIPQYYKRRAVSTAFYRDTALLRPPYIGIPSYSDRLVSGYRLTQTALYRDTDLLRPPYLGTLTRTPIGVALLALFIFLVVGAP